MKCFKRSSTSQSCFSLGKYLPDHFKNMSWFTRGRRKI